MEHTQICRQVGSSKPALQPAYVQRLPVGDTTQTVYVLGSVSHELLRNFVHRRACKFAQCLYGQRQLWFTALALFAAVLVRIDILLVREQVVAAPVSAKTLFVPGFVDRGGLMEHNLLVTAVGSNLTSGSSQASRLCLAATPYSRRRSGIRTTPQHAGGVWTRCMATAGLPKH